MRLCFAEHSCKTWLFSHCVSFKWFIHIPLPQTSLSPVFQTFSIQYPEYQIELLATAQYTLFSVHLVPRAISTSRQNKQLFVVLKVFYTGKIFLSHYPLRTPLSEAGWLKFSTFRQYLKWFKSGRTISKVVRNFFFFSQLVIENLWWGHMSGLRKRRQFSRNSHRNLTCLCNLFLPLRLSQVNHVHIPPPLMTKYCCECPSLWLFGQLTPCLWWAAQEVPNKNWKLSLKRKIAIWREWNSLIKNPKGLLCDSSSEAAQSSYRVCRSTQCQTLQAPLDMTVCTAQGAGRLAQQPVLIAMPSLVLDSTQNCHARLLTSLINCSKQHDRMKYTLLYKTKEVQEALYTSFSLVGESRGRNLSFTLVGTFDILITGLLENLPRWQAP